jgi:hypothetical protein
MSETEFYTLTKAHKETWEAAVEKIRESLTSNPFYVNYYNLINRTALGFFHEATNTSVALDDGYRLKTGSGIATIIAGGVTAILTYFRLTTFTVISCAEQINNYTPAAIANVTNAVYQSFIASLNASRLTETFPPDYFKETIASLTQETLALGIELMKSQLSTNNSTGPNLGLGILLTGTLTTALAFLTLYGIHRESLDKKGFDLFTKVIRPFEESLHNLADELALKQEVAERIVALLISPDRHEMKPVGEVDYPTDTTKGKEEDYADAYDYGSSEQEAASSSKKDTLIPFEDEHQDPHMEMLEEISPRKKLQALMMQRIFKQLDDAPYLENYVIVERNLDHIAKKPEMIPVVFSFAKTFYHDQSTLEKTEKILKILSNTHQVRDLWDFVQENTNEVLTLIQKLCLILSDPNMLAIYHILKVVHIQDIDKLEHISNLLSLTSTRLINSFIERVEHLDDDEFEMFKNCCHKLIKIHLDDLPDVLNNMIIETFSRHPVTPIN